MKIRITLNDHDIARGFARAVQLGEQIASSPMGQWLVGAGMRSMMVSSGAAKPCGCHETTTQQPEPEVVGPSSPLPDAAAAATTPKVTTP